MSARGLPPIVLLRSQNWVVWLWSLNTSSSSSKTVRDDEGSNKYSKESEESEGGGDGERANYRGKVSYGGE